MQAKPLTVRVTDGGRLITVGSSENVGPANYVEKTNWRRLDDKEVRREGNLAFPGTLAACIGMWEAVRPNGDRALIGATASQIYRHNGTTWNSIGSGFTAAYWEGESIDGYLVLNNGTDLPQYYRVEDANVTPLKELREIGVACVGTIAVHNGFLLVGDVTEIIDAELAGIMNSETPYGVVASNKVNRIRYKAGWSDLADPTNWSPIVTATIESADKDEIVLPYPMSAFPVGAKLLVLGAGPGGGALGGQTNFPDGVTVTTVDGATLTINTEADPTLTYPLTVSVLRFADSSTFSGFASIQDDSSGIVKMKTLKSALIVYRETGIFTARYTGIVETPFLFTPGYRGENVPAWRNAIADVEGDYHVYATRNKFYFFDGAGNPQVHRVLDDARSLFFANTGSQPFATLNRATNEVWFCNAVGVLAFDFLHNTASWIDQVYTAAVYLETEKKFLHAISTNILQYGRLAGANAALTYLRAGAVPNIASLTHGYGKWPMRENGRPAEDFSEVDLLGYLPLLDSGAGNVQITITLRGKDNVADADETLFTEVLATPRTEPLIPAFYRNIYYQDRIQVTSAADAAFAIVGAAWQFNPVNSRGITRFIS
jgi:hypothetical protein